MSGWVSSAPTSYDSSSETVIHTVVTTTSQTANFSSHCLVTRTGPPSAITSVSAVKTKTQT